VKAARPVLNGGCEETCHKVTRLAPTQQQMEATFTTVQAEYQRLHRTVQTKRLVLADKNEELRRVLAREASHQETIATLRQTNARLHREYQELQHQHAQQHAALAHEQRQHATLSQRHDALVGEYHQLFQRFQREKMA
jgi:chromosome segregation ATPase